MYSILDQLNAEFDDLRSFASSINPVNSALATHPDPSVRKYLTLRRQYDYAAFIVAIYASFERYSESLVSEYARILSTFTPYEDLPPLLIKKHLSQSADMFKKRLGEGRYAHLLPINIAENLYRCLSGDANYTLTSDAIIAHDSNLRYSDVSKLFGDVGIDQLVDRLPGTDAIQQWLSIAHPEGAPDNNNRIKVILESRINDLVDRRNEVAHRGGSADELLGQNELIELLEFMKAFSTGVFFLAAGEYLKKKICTENYAELLIQTEGPYKKGSVIVTKAPKLGVKVGQPIFAVSANGHARWGRISELNVEENRVDAIEPNSEIPSIGMLLSYSCKGSSQVYLLAQEDETIWPSTNLS